MEWSFGRPIGKGASHGASLRVDRPAAGPRARLVAPRVFQRITAPHPDEQLIVPRDAMCRAENCIMVLDGEDLYHDDNHFRGNLRETTNLERFAR